MMNLPGRINMTKDGDEWIATYRNYNGFSMKFGMRGKTKQEARDKLINVILTAIVRDLNEHPEDVEEGV